MAAQFDVFLSHNSKDKQAVTALAQALRGAGLTSWLDAWHLTRGREWQGELAAGLSMCRACAVCLGPHGVGAWSGMEMRLALDRAAKDADFRLFTVLLPGLPEPFDAAALPPFLSVYTWVDLRAGLNHPGALERLIAAVRGQAGPPPSPPSLLTPPAPTAHQGAGQHNLPALVTGFVGRAAEQAAVGALLERARLVTLWGPGGVGKTRLAFMAASAQAAHAPDGVWLVELAALQEPALVTALVAEALGVREEADRPLLATLIGWIGARRLLLVLDNCEHLVGACAALVAAVLRACAAVCVLATSREALETPGEQLFGVPPLAVPDPEHLPSLASLAQVEAVQLFVQRAQAQRPDFALSAGNAPAVVEICRRLDGIPLAIELAAARVRALPVQTIADRLHDRFRLLTGGPRTALPRQQTLRAALDWSYDLLGDAERELLRHLSVFAGGWTLEAAVAVWPEGADGEWEVLDRLDGLVNRALVQLEEDAPTPRYGLLETVRQYAREKRDQAGEEVAARTGHLQWCLALAAQAEGALLGPQQAHWLNLLEQEHANLRVALDWSLTTPGQAALGVDLAGRLWRFWDMRGSISEGYAWLDRALATGAGEDAARARAYNGAGNLALRQANSARARACHEQSLALRRALHDTHGQASSLANLGNVAWQTGDYAAATELLRGSQALYRSLGETWGSTAALASLAGVALDQGDHGRAGDLYQEALTGYRTLGDADGVAASLTGLGAVARVLEEYPRAVTLYQEGLALYHDLNDRVGVAFCLEGLALAAVDQQRHEQAAWLFGAADALRSALGSALGSNDQTVHAAALATLHAGPGGTTIEAALAAGHVSTVEQAVAVALALPAVAH